MAAATLLLAGCGVFDQALKMYNQYQAEKTMQQMQVEAQFKLINAATEVRGKMNMHGRGPASALNLNSLYEKGDHYYLAFDTSGTYCSDCYIHKHGFKIVAYGNLDSDPTLDIWTIDQNRNVVHVRNDIEQ
jgi:hypothetical protein